SEAQEEARLPAPDAYPGRPGGHRPPAVQGTRAPLRLIWRIRDRASFRALAGGRRRRKGVLVLTAVPVAEAGGRPRVGYAIDRRLGNAVTRNRVRRQLRAAVREQASGLVRGHAYLIRALPGSAEASYRELSETLAVLLRQSTRVE